MHSTVIDLRIGGHFRAAPTGKGPRLTAGDLVTWTNQNTGEIWSELVVEFVYPMQGIALVRGCFGGLVARTGDFKVESRRIRIDQLTINGKAAAVGAV